MTTKTFHYISGCTITVFIVLHLGNHISSIWGEETHINVMRALRPIYRNIFVETILLLLIIAQIVSGIRMALTKRKVIATMFDRIQIWSGIYLVLFFVIHVSAVLTGRLILKLDTNFYFGAAGINTFPYNIFFIPYYAIAIMSVFAHLAAVHDKKMKRTILGFTPRTQALFVIISGLVFTLLIFYGFTGHFAHVIVPEAYKILVGGR